MAPSATEIIQVNLEDEMRKSYLDYAMSVIVGRALPDARDGLKPVHRRVLYAMNELGAHSNRPYYKSARIVGDVIGKYHPHGDASVYDTLVRMAQPFSLRYVLVDGQGNFGSIDDDPAAAMRYTEARMSALTHELLADIDRETVDFQPNYDEKELEPTVMPTGFPNLLVNGSAGIAVGMATHIPPHNLTETINACLALIDNPEIDIAGLMKHIHGPDFPTGGIINGTSGIISGYRTGRGRVRIRARADIEVMANGRQAIIVTELPYLVVKSRLIEKISALVKEKKIEGISELRDESDKDGLRIYIEIRRGASAEVVLNNLYQQTALESSFGMNMVALVNGRPKVLNLKEILQIFINHRREVVTRRTLFELRKAKARAHVLEGLTVALANIDEMIGSIKTAANPLKAKEHLLGKAWLAGRVSALPNANHWQPDDLPTGVGLKDGRYQLSEIQAQQILEMRLNRLTNLEQDRLTEEYSQLLDTITGLTSILEKPDVLLEVIGRELEGIVRDYGDNRRSEIRFNEEDLNTLDLIAPEDMVVTLSHTGYVKRQPVSDYQSQRRGGRGRRAAATRDEDSIEQLWLVNTHDTLLVFTSTGKVFWLPVHQLPEAGSNSRGRPIINWLALESGEHIQAVLPVHNYDENHYLFFATRNGVVKKTPLTEFSRPFGPGKKAIILDENDALVNVAITDGSRDILLFASNGRALRFPEESVRSMGRNAAGVRGIRLDKDETVVSLIVADHAANFADDDNESEEEPMITNEVTLDETDELPAENEVIPDNPDNNVLCILTATENGYGTRTPLDIYPCKKRRGSRGVLGIRTDKRNGKLISAILLNPGDDVLLISDGGTLVRTPSAQIRQIKTRASMGVKLIRLSKGETLQAIERLDAALDESSTEQDTTSQVSDNKPAIEVAV